MNDKTFYRSQWRGVGHVPLQKKGSLFIRIDSLSLRIPPPGVEYIQTRREESQVFVRVAHAAGLQVNDKDTPILDEHMTRSKRAMDPA